MSIIDEAGSPYTTENLLAGIVIKDTVYDLVEMREITGLEEDYLAEKKGSVTSKISKVLASCIKRLKSSSKEDAIIEDSIDISRAVNDMAVGDRIYLFIRLRVLSLGEKFNMEFVAPSDGTIFKGMINLNDLEIKTLEDKSKRTHSFTTPKGKEVVIRLAVGKDEEKLDAIGNSKFRATMALMQRLVTINNVAPTIETLQKLSLSERNFIREQLDKFDAGVDTTVIAIDPNTQKEFEAELGIGQKDFFFPSET